MGRERGIEVIVDGAHAFAPLPLHARRPRLRLLRHQPAQVAVRAARHRLPVRAARRRSRSVWPLMAGRRDAGRRHPQVRGDRHAPGRQPQRDRRGADVPPGHRDRAQGGAPALPARPLPAPARGAAARVKRAHQLRPGDVVRDRQRPGRRASTARRSPSTCWTSTASSWCRSSTPSSRACASRRASTRRPTRSTASPRRSSR